MDVPEENCDPPRKKRRSSIFHRCPPVDAQSNESSSHSIPPLAPETSEQLTIKRYSEKVKEETKKWKDLLQERKSYYRSLNSRQKPPNTDESLTYDKAGLLLTEEDKIFLEDKGKYVELREEMEDLLCFASMVKVQQQNIISLEKHIINAAQDRIEAVTGDICQYIAKKMTLPSSKCK